MPLEPLPIAHTHGHNRQYCVWQQQISESLATLDSLHDEILQWMDARTNEWAQTERATKLQREVDTLDHALDLLASLNIRKAPK